MTHLEILTFLNKTFSANFYLVGGFVRDMLSEKPSLDYDIATNMLPETIMQIAQAKGLKAIPTGIKHGTVTLIVDSIPLEITTFRKDFNNNGRHCNVEFTTSMQKDAQRRDFTINALYLDEHNKIYDFHNGQKDLQEGVLKFIGSPRDRIKEDYLRILRFFRFLSVTNKNKDSLTKDLISIFEEETANLSILSRERISQEFVKICEKEYFIKSFLGMLKVKNLQDYFKLSKQIKNFKDKDLSLIKHWDGFNKLCLIYSFNLDGILQKDNFRWSNKQKARVRTYTNSTQLDVLSENFTKNAFIHGKKSIEFAIIQKYFIGKLSKDVAVSKLDELESLEVPIFPLKGKDLIAIGFNKNKELGMILKQVESFWINNNFTNKTQCLDFARKLLKKYIY
ncbi:MAG: CCA tRNA nucleotidyltransferase [Proteobacteria bacterium]|nr:CCA tRNA nucleotidyltransferase [Pseudomonadota bacterium]